MTLEPLDFTRGVFEFLAPRDILIIVQVCSAWYTVLRDSPAFFDAHRVMEVWLKYKVMKRQQESYSIPPYLVGREDFSPGMRAVLTEWLLQVSEEFSNRPETLFLAVNLVDLYMSKKTVPRTKVQLVGITCLLIASKMEETHYPDIGELLYLCDGIYTRPQLLDMEMKVVMTVRCTANMPTVISFAELFLQESGVGTSGPAASLTRYLAELSILYHPAGSLSSSLVGLAIVCVACWQYRHSFRSIVELSSYSVHDLLPYVQAVQAMILEVRDGPTGYIPRKYNSEEEHKVAALELDTADLASFLEARGLPL